MPLEFARKLQYSDPQEFHALKAMAYAYYWQHKTPQDENLRKMLEYVTYIEDESNRLYKQMSERL